MSITKDTQLREAPLFDSPVTAIKQGTRGQVSAKQGPWLRVNVNGQMGWVLTTDVAFGAYAPDEQAQKNGLAVTLFGANRSQHLQQQTTLTIGIRVCFENESFFAGPISEIQQALLDSYAVSKEDAYALHALPAGLVAQPLALP